MGRLRNPDVYAELTGATKKDPQRYRDRPPQNVRALAGPPKDFSVSQKKIWNEIVENAPLGVLTGTDSIIVELLAILLNELRDIEKSNRNTIRELKLWQKQLDELLARYDNQKLPTDQIKTMKLIQNQFKREPILTKYPTSRLAAMASIMARMGMTPADRAKLITLDEAGARSKTLTRSNQ